MYHKTFEGAYPVEMPDITPKPVVERRPGIFATIIVGIRDRAVRTARRRRFAREFRQLKKLTDRDLRDIGMHRGDITETRLRELLRDPANWDV